MKRSLLFMACLGLCACLLTACAKKTDFSAGTEMTAEELRQYREKLLAQKEQAKQEESAEDVGAEKPVTDLADLICYYTENGSVWHADRNCSYLKRSQNVLEGSAEGAAIAGKSRPCSGCAAAYIEE